MFLPRDLLFENWDDVKDQLRQRWSKLSEADVAGLDGHTDGLTRVLRLRYGYARTQAKLEITQWLVDHNWPAAKPSLSNPH